MAAKEVKFNTDERLRLGEFGIQARLVKAPSQGSEQPPAPAEEGRTMVYKAAPPPERPAEPAARPAPVLSRAVVESRGTRQVLSGPRATIGRSDEADCVLRDPNISRIHAELVGVVRQDLLDEHDEPVVGLLGLHAPDLRHPLVGLIGGGLLHVQGRGRRHPVEGLVGTAVGVHQHRAVRLHHEQAGGGGQVGVQAALIGHGAAGNDESHRSILGGPCPPARVPAWRHAPFEPPPPLVRASAE